jgi:Mce-associated membrane protein
MSTWEPPVQPARRDGGRTVWAVALVVVAVLLAGAALWARSVADDRADEANRLTRTAARADGEARQLVENADNEALSDAEGTRQVVDQLTTAVETTFSYDHTDLESTANAVEEHLTGDARCAYDALFAEVKRLAPEQKIVVTTTVREIALVSLAGDRAEALVYIDQQSTRADTNRSAYVAGQLAVRALRDGDRWKVAELDLFDQPLANGEPAPTC